ncbi:glutaredoxin family protein [bacterium]|nr:glutaredoxin family protein [bacterium]
MKIKILSKPDCHLCDVAKEAIQRVTKRLPIEIEVIDIEKDPELFNQYRNDIPVIFLDERKIFKHRVDEQKLKKILGISD